MKHNLIGYILVFCVLFLIGCKNHPEEAHDERELITKLIDSIKSGDWNNVSKFILNPENAQRFDKALMLAPQNGNVTTKNLLSLAEARVEWSDMNDFFDSKASEPDKVLRLDWKYSTEHGAAELEQYYIITAKEGKFFIRL